MVFLNALVTDRISEDQKVVVTTHIRKALSDEKYGKRTSVSLIKIMEEVLLENELQGVSAYTDMTHTKQIFSNLSGQYCAARVCLLSLVWLLVCHLDSSLVVYNTAGMIWLKIKSYSEYQNTSLI